MLLIPDFQERQRLAEADRHLHIADHCLVRQLHTLSQLGRHGANLHLAEAVLKTMLRTHELMVQDKEWIEHKLALDGAGPEGNTDSPSKAIRRGQALEAEGEATLLLKKNKLRSKSSE